MARQELLLLCLTWAALIGVGVAHRLATWEATLWCVVLLTQSQPYAASVVTSVVAAMPSLRGRAAVQSASMLGLGGRASASGAGAD